jgi:UDPglucose 6-dehydrogenase
MNVVVVGVGYVGLITGLSLAKLGNKITFLDTDKSKIDQLILGISTFQEPELEDYLNDSKISNKVIYLDSYEAVNWDDCDVVLVCVQTPTNDSGQVNSKFISNVFNSINGKVSKNSVICVKSTIHPIALKDVINETNINFDNLVFNPEFLREGSAFFDFFNPDRIVVGSNNLKHSEIIASLYKNLDSELVFTDPISSQLIKYLSNTYLPMRLSFVNEAIRLSDALNANFSDVLRGIGLDARIGDNYFRPSPGWGGSCFPKDVKEVNSLSEFSNLSLPIINAISESNDSHQLWFSEKLISLMISNNLERVCLLGGAFKENTDDTRYSPTFNIYNILVKEDVEVSIYDPNLDLPNEFNQIETVDNNSLFVEMYPLGETFDTIKNTINTLSNFVYFKIWD